MVRKSEKNKPTQKVLLLLILRVSFYQFREKSGGYKRHKDFIIFFLLVIA